MFSPLLAVLLAAAPGAARAETRSWTPTSSNGRLRIEILSDTLFHIEIGGSPESRGPIPVSPYVVRRDFPGPREFRASADGSAVETARYRLEASSSGECVSIRELASALLLTRICPSDGGDGKPAGFTLSRGTMRNVYGLGEQFRNPGEANGDWMGQVRAQKIPEGNSLEGFEGAAVGNAQVPVMYALGSGRTGYALYADQAESLTWDFRGDPWKVSERAGPLPTGQAIRLYWIGGEDLPSLRRQYMDLVGRPPVPPKKAFGMWLSEFGYRSWSEIDAKLATLRKRGFPIDGFVLDAYWYGEFYNGNLHNHFGNMNWEPAYFPDPATHVRRLRDQGIGLMLAENPFINDWLPEFRAMSDRKGLVKQCASCGPVVLDNYLGRIGIIDWTNDETADYWHLAKRQPLMDLGIRLHWTDFAEIDGHGGQDAGEWYHGVAPFGHSAAGNHNLYAFKWAESIERGYRKLSRSDERYLILSRSTAPGMQRLGTCLWSGDIGSNLRSLAAQLNAQMQLSLSGIDYFGSDAGGYNRQALQGDVNDVYTKWFAHSAAFDFPLRPHMNNWDHSQEDAPDRIGDREANRANLRLRYELGPYYYSLAHRAYLDGEPVVPPLVYYFQEDPNVRTIADEKMIGPWILAGAAPADGKVVRDLYLPAGEWIDYRSQERYQSTGQTFSFDYQASGHFELPFLVRKGAIIPTLWVDDATLDVLGRRSDGAVIDDLNLRVYPSRAGTSFEVDEDDGGTIAYQKGAVARTLVEQRESPSAVEIGINPTRGAYDGAPTSRRTVLRVFTSDRVPGSVLLNGAALPRFTTRAEFERADYGWFFQKGELLLIRSPSLPVSSGKHFRVEF